MGYIGSDLGVRWGYRLIVLAGGVRLGALSDSVSPS